MLKNLMDSNTYESDGYLQLSGIQHFSFCRRQWALIHVESQWAENFYTVSGDLMHERAHDKSIREKRGDVIITRDMPIVSHSMQVRGKCDVVEFRREEDGITIFGCDGFWQPYPVEYKRGKPKLHDADKLQLCAQAMCLEEMLLCAQIDVAFLYYGETKHREKVLLDEEIRKTVRTMFEEMHRYFSRSYTPRVKKSKSCSNCSLAPVCLPKLPREGSVDLYIKSALKDDEKQCGSY